MGCAEPFVWLQDQKPVTFDFIDASTPGRRKRLCLQELRLNRRLAPELHLGLVTICQSPEGLVLGDDGPVVEPATQMPRLPQGSLAPVGGRTD